MSHEKTAIFIDGASVHASERILGIQLDYGKFRDELLFTYPGATLHYYLAYLNTAHQARRPLLDWLRHNGYYVHENMVTLPPKEKERDYNVRVKCDVDLTIGVCNAVLVDDVKLVVLVSGSATYAALGRWLKSKKIPLDVWSSEKALGANLEDVAELVTLIESIPSLTLKARA